MRIAGHEMDRHDGRTAGAVDVLGHVFALNPAFVQGTSDEPAVRRDAAGPAHGRGIGSLLHPRAAGDGAEPVEDEGARYAGLAGDGIVFHEPGTGCWFRVAAGRVAPLNGPARTTIGNRSVPVAAYQRSVMRRLGPRRDDAAQGRRRLYA